MSLLLVTFRWEIFVVPERSGVNGVDITTVVRGDNEWGANDTRFVIHVVCHHLTSPS